MYGLLPLVTVVTPSYNHGDYIEETILSVLNQDYPKIEYIIIDGGSTDNTVAILNKYKHRVLFISEPDNGQSHAINKGFLLAQGEILCWLNSDDTFEPGAIRNIAEHFSTHPETIMLVGGANLVDKSGKFLSLLAATKPFDLWRTVYLTQVIPQPATFFRRNVVDSIGLLDENLHWCMDLDYWIRIGSRFKIDCVDWVLANWRLYPEAKTSSGGFKRWQEIISIQKKYANVSFLYWLIWAGLGSIYMLFRYSYPSIYYYIRGPISKLVSKLTQNITCNYHGVYPNNWLGRKSRFMYPKLTEPCAARFVFDMPDDQRLLPNSLVIKSNGVTVEQLEMSVPGNYEICVPFGGGPEFPPEIELIFSRALPPDSQRRRLACKLVSVDFVS